MFVESLRVSVIVSFSQRYLITGSLPRETVYTGLRLPVRGCPVGGVVLRLLGKGLAVESRLFVVATGLGGGVAASTRRGTRVEVLVDVRGGGEVEVSSGGGTSSISSL